MIKFAAIATAAAIACCNTPAVCSNPNALHPTPHCTQSVCTDTQLPETGGSTVTASAYAQEVVRLDNIERENAGLAPLTLDETLCAAAGTRRGDRHRVFPHAPRRQQLLYGAEGDGHFLPCLR